MVAYIFDATKGETPATLAQKRAVAKALVQGQRSPQNVGEGISALGDGIVARVLSDRADSAEAAGMASANDAFAPIIAALGGGEFPAAPAAPRQQSPAVSTMDPLSTEAATGQIPPNNDLRSGILETAKSLGIDPVDLATAISYETGGTFDPLKRGPTTQWGQHRGLIQFGEPQAKEHGVDWNNPLGSQLGPNGAVASYLRKSGVTPGMGLMDVYSAINAGAPGRYNRSDANNGGAPGTVRDKVERQMAGHRQKALALIGDAGVSPAATALDNLASGGVQVASMDPSAGVMEAGAEQGLPADNAGLLALARLKAQQDAPSVAAGVGRVATGAPRAGGAEIGMDDVRRMAANRPTDGVAYSGPGATISQDDLQRNQFTALDRELGIQRTPPIAPVPMDRVAQALIGGQTDALPEMAGNSPAGAMPSIAQLLAAGGNPFMPEGNQKIINMLIEQEMQRRDPAYKLGLEKSQLEVDAMRNPRMSPSEQANYDLNVRKFGAEDADRTADNAREDRRFGSEEAQRAFEREFKGKEFGLNERKFASEDADRTADNTRADSELAIKQLEYMLKTEPDFYAKYVAQEEAAGRQPLGILDYAKQLKQAGAATNTVNLGGGDNKQVFDAVNESAVSARAAATGLASLQEAKRAVDAGIISGAGADMRLGLQKIGAMFGVADPSVIENTETFQAAIAPQVAAMMKATVGSTQISNADREFAQKAAGGSINLDAASIKRLIGIMDRGGRAVVEAHRQRLDQVYPDGQNFGRERALFGVPAPAALLPETVPTGVDPEDWKYLTPEERKLFQ